MSKTIFLIAGIIICCWCRPVYGQQKTLGSAGSKESRADAIFRKTLQILENHPDRLLQAVAVFESIYPSDSGNALLNLRLGAAYLQLNMPAKGIPFIRKSATLDYNTEMGDLPFYLAWCLQLENKFKEAGEKYLEYKNDPKANNALLRKEIDQRIRECITGDSLINHPVNVAIANVGSTVNSVYAEMTPIVNADESSLFFTARKFNDATQEQYEKIFYSNKINGSWSSPVQIRFSEEMDVHEAISGLFPDGHEMLVYEGDINKGDIFQSSYINGEWTPLRDPGKNINTSYHESSACYSPQARSIYFVSDRPGGYGGRDIYISEYNLAEQTWGPAVNIGPVINTAFDEEGVFLHPSGRKLYFASKGHAGMGGYDLYYSELKDGKWQTPVNLGYPINTSSDDVYASLSADGNHLYFSSLRSEGFGEKDIYCATLHGGTVSNLVLITGYVKDAESDSAIKANVDLFDLQKDEKLGTYKTDPGTGKYTIPLPAGKKYGIVIYADGYLFESENIEVNDSTAYRHYTHEKKLKKLEPGKSTLLNNIFFGKGKTEPLPESTNELNRVFALLKNYPALKIEIAGHTDNVGSDEYNVTLSTNRAKAIYDYLVSKGIKPERLSYIGHGKSKPIAGNDTEEGRKANRRIEFKVVAK